MTFDQAERWHNKHGNKFASMQSMQSMQNRTSVGTVFVFFFRCGFLFRSMSLHCTLAETKTCDLVNTHADSGGVDGTFATLDTH